MLTYHRAFGNVAIPNVEPSEFVMNRCFSYNLDDKNILITTNHGGWMILSNGEYNLLLDGAVEKDTNLYAALEQKGILLTGRNQADILQISCEQYAYLNRTPSRLVIWGPGSNSDGLNREVQLRDRLEEVGSKAVEFFLSIPQLIDRVHIEFRGNLLSQYPLIQKVMNYAMVCSREKRKEISFTLVSSPHLMTDEIAMDLVKRRVKYYAYFDGSDESIDGLRKIQREYRQNNQLLPIQLIIFPLDYIGGEKQLVDECLALGLNRITVKYADASHPVEKYRKTFLSPEEYYDFWTNTLELIIEHNRNGVFFIEGQTQELLQNIIIPGANSADSRRPCGAGVSQLVVDLAGRILACYCAEWLEMGSVFTDTYDMVITSANGVTARCLASDLLPKCSTCAFNAYCGHCPVRSLQQHGTSLLEEPEDFECQIYIRMIPYLFNKLKDVKDAKLLTKWV